jgi:hypothetical protein
MSRIRGAPMLRLLLPLSVFFVLGWSSMGYACFILLPTVQVSESFSVFVRNGPDNLPSIQVEVLDQAGLKGDATWEPSLNLVTGKDGAVHIQNLHPGTYLVATKGPGQGSGVYVEVSDKPGRRSNEVTLAWPSSNSETLNVKTLAGELKSNDPWKPFENVNVELWTAGADAPLAIEDTGVEGRFQFSETKPGIYILRIRGRQKNVGDNWQVEGEIPVRLSPAAVSLPEPLSLYLGMSSCGISYNSCPIPSTLAMPARRLQARDPLGALIPNAKFRVLDPSGAELATGSMDSNGVAELPSKLNGKVTLVVASPGLALLTLPLDLLPPDNEKYLAVVMDVQGNSCSTAHLEKYATPQ